MKYLQLQHWRKFLKSAQEIGEGAGAEAPFDGVAFEKLARSILSRLYGQKWEGTKATHDGSRDFYADADGGQMWAECKMYKKPVSIHVISPTLVMALLDGVQRLVIISYSPLNRNALHHLAQYAAVARCQIDVIDDEVLEAVILANWRRFKKHFTDDCRPPAKREALPCIPSQVIVFQPHLAQLSDEGEKLSLAQGLLLRRGQTIAVDLCIRNPDPTETRAGHIRVDCGADPAILLLTTDGETGTNRFPATILPRAVHHRRLFFKVKNYRRSTALPTIVVSMDGQPDILLERIEVGISSLPMASLTGALHHTILQRMRAQARRPGAVRSMTLAGRSGTGKSRLLKEFGDVFAELGHQATMVDVEAGDRDSFDNFARLLLSQAYRLPLLNPERRLRSGEQARRIADTHIARVEDILYDEPGPLNARLEECADLLLAAIATRRTALVVDNVQFLDEEGCRLLGRLLDLVIDKQGDCHLVFCFNIDFLAPGTVAASLYGRLRALHNDDLHQTHDLKDFSPDDARAFLNASLSSAQMAPDLLFTQRYEGVAADMLARCALRPFFLGLKPNQIVDFA